MKLLRLFALAAMSILLSGCLSGEVKDQAKRLDESIKALGQKLEAAQTAFSQVQQGADWKFYQPYAEREKWNDWLSEAATLIATTRSQYTASVAPILKKGDSKDEPMLKSMLTTLEASVAPAHKAITRVADRMNFLVVAKASAEQYQVTSVAHIARIDELVLPHVSVIAQAKAEFAHRAADIDQRYSVLTNLQTAAKSAMEKFSAEYQKHQGDGQADYAVLGDSARSIAEARTELEKSSPAFGDALRSLPKDYLRVLTDMRVDYRVVIGRATWDESSDWDTTKNYIYTAVSVPKATFEYLQKLSQGESQGNAGYIARPIKGWSGFSTQTFIDAEIWRSIKIDQHVDWPSGHDDGMFWVEEFDPKFYHKYQDITGVKQTATDWVEVEEDDFLEHLNDMGMAIRSKAIGQFDDEATEQAVPPGMAMVGNPKYGQWQTTNTGERHWGFFENYLFYHWLFGSSSNHRYSYGDYESYRRWQSDPQRTAGWYGRDAEKPTYGSNGSYTQNSALYRQAAFSKIGGSEGIPSTMREAGARMRGRGPRGGK